MLRFLSAVPFQGIRDRVYRSPGERTIHILWFAALFAAVLPVYTSHLGLEQYRLYSVFRLAAAAFSASVMAFKIGFLDQNSWGKLLCMGACLLVLAVGCLRSGVFSLLTTFLAVFSARGISFRKISRFYFVFFLSTLLLNMLLLAMGVLQDNSYLREEMVGLGVVRHSLGFGHPNNLGFWCMLLVFSGLLAFRWRSNTAVYIVLLLVTALGFLVSNSKAFLVAAVFAILCCWAAELLRKPLDRMRRMPAVCAGLLVLIAVCYTVLSLIFDREVAILRALNYLLSLRIELSNWGLRDCGISLFGQQLVYQNPVDSLYTYGPIWLGLLPSVLFLLLAVKSIWRGAAHRRWEIVAVSIAAALYSTMECGLINPVHAALFAATAELTTDEPTQ